MCRLQATGQARHREHSWSVQSHPEIRELDDIGDWRVSGEWRVEKGEERVLGVIRNLNYTEYYSICGYLKPQPTIWQNNKI